MDKITKAEYIFWKNHPVTKAMRKALEEMDLEVKEQMIDDNLLMRSDGQLSIVRLAGVRDGLSQVLNLQVEDFADDETTD